MNDKTIYILFYIGIGLTIIVFLFLIFLRFFSPENTPPSAPEPTPVVIATPTPIPFTKPTRQTLTINNLTVPNFYKTGSVINENGDVSLEKNRQYEIVYLAPFEEFIIDILATPFEQNRFQAEQALLRKLNLSQTQACLLTVSIGTPYEVNPDHAGIKYRLSFCE